MFAIVVGAGITGRSASSYLLALGNDVLLYDDHQVDCSHSQFNITTDLDYTLAQLKQADALILSPSVPLSHVLVAEAGKRVRVMSEVDLALSAYHGTVVAVTGTNGKSTVCKYIQHLLRKNNCASAMAGNIGVPATSILLSDHPDYLVLELSSYQLAQSSPPAVKVAVFTNFGVDHLQYHRDLASYFKAKSKIFANAELAISTSEVFRRSPQAQHLVVSESSVELHTGEQVLQHSSCAAEFSALAPHDISNAMMAVLAVKHLIGGTMQQLAQELHDCEKPTHRLQYIGSSNGYPVINDSKATNVEATLAALRAQSEPVLLIIGGMSKSQKFSPLLGLRNKITKLYIFGVDGKLIYAQLASHLPCLLFPNLAAVMRRLTTELPLLASGVLFSPACATDAEFKDFAARGDAFMRSMNIKSSGL